MEGRNHWIVKGLKRRRVEAAEGERDLTLKRFIALTTYVASRGLSVPVIDSRIDVSAWTFFMR